MRKLLLFHYAVEVYGAVPHDPAKTCPINLPYLAWYFGVKRYAGSPPVPFVAVLVQEHFRFGTGFKIFDVVGSPNFKIVKNFSAIIKAALLLIDCLTARKVEKLCAVSFAKSCPEVGFFLVIVGNVHTETGIDVRDEEFPVKRR